MQMAIALNSGCMDSVVMIEAEPRFAVQHTRGIMLPQESRECHSHKHMCDGYIH